MNLRYRRTSVGAAVMGLVVGGLALVPAAPAAAHSGHFSCGSYWSTSPQNLKRTCYSVAPGAAFRVWTTCYYISGTRSPITTYGNWVSLNRSSGTSTVTCGTGYEPGSGNTQFTHN
jgi:hypothetical protein